jgi:hypothetical protein
MSLFRNSRFGAFYSRLGRREFPVRVATGIFRQRVDLAHHFCGEVTADLGKIEKFPVYREKSGFALPAS